ncbi:TPA: ROK family protein [Vibrio cholerae]|nr:ROK family protein [Vibrio cholerae]ELJ8748480.1 ROK family protein [Vibrio cholerae]
MLIDDGGLPLYHGQLISPTNMQQTAELITNVALNMQRMFGTLTLIGINLMPDCWQGALPKAKETLSQWLSTHLTVPYQILNPAVIALAQVQPLPQGNTLSAVLDDGCELYVTDQLNPNDPYRHVLDLGWTHKPLKGYQSLIDGLTPLCTCGSDECIRQYLSRKGLERQYHQLSLQHCTASEIIQNVAQNQAWSTRIYRIWIDQLARALSDAIIHFKPKLLILSGGLIQHPDLALTLRSALSRYCLSEALPKIECLNNEGYDFAKGSVSMYTVNCAQPPTFTS